jgi:hypothetical protein
VVGQRMKRDYPCSNYQEPVNPGSTHAYIHFN